MAATATKPLKNRRAKSRPRIEKPSGAANGTVDVLTLSEAAEYLRVTETAVLQAITDQNLPARQVGQDWRILRSAIQQWLLNPQSRPTGKAALQSLAGAWQDDPTVEPMLSEIYRQRGRPMAEKST